MKSKRYIQRHLGSVFVTSAFLDEFNIGLAMDIASIVSRARSPSTKYSAYAAFPVASVLDAAQEICAQANVADEASLEEMLETVHKQFDIVDECNETDKEVALEALERSFSGACESARAALEEVQAGFPVCGGDFAVWREDVHLNRPCD
jgi:hypothetical protein